MRLGDLERLIPQYAMNKAELDSYKKLCDRENAKIKAIMQDFVISKYKAGGYKATCYKSTRESFNEELLLNIINNAPDAESIRTKIVKTKEYIDFDALEKAIYNNEISEELLLKMDDAKEIKTTATLRVVKIRKEE